MPFAEVEVEYVNRDPDLATHGWTGEPRITAPHPALEVLAPVLIEGKTIRLYRAIIDKNLGISADAGKGFFHDNMRGRSGS